MAQGSNYLTTYYAKRIIGDTAAADAAAALLQTGANIHTDTWILDRTNRANTYGIKYLFDNTTNGTADKIEFYGGQQANDVDVPSAWIQLDTGDLYLLGKAGIGATPNADYRLYVYGATGLANGHLYLTGSNANSSTGNTTQIIFGTPTTNHVAISSNTGTVIINPTSTTTTGQILLAANGNSAFTAGTLAINTGAQSVYKLYVNGDSYLSDNNYFCVNSGYANFGDTVQFSNTTSWKKGTMIVGANGSDKIIIGYLNSSTNGAIVGAHVSSCTAWAPLYFAGTQLYIRGSETTWAKWIDGCLSLFPVSGDYREGIRIHSVGSWSDITLCGNDNTGDSGISANSWFIGNNNGNFYITRYGSTSSGADAQRSEFSSVSNQWRLRSYVQAHKSGIYRSGLHIYGPTYGNTAADMVSGTAGLFSWGDGGPQITFDTSATPGEAQAGALIFTDNDTAGAGVSWHFVSNQSDWVVTSKRFKALTDFNGPLVHTAGGVSYIAGAKGTKATVYAKKATGSVWRPAVCLQTSGGGAWQIGNYDDETLEFQYATKANIDSQTNTTSEIYMQNGDTGRVMTSGNYTNWTVTKTGSGASGTWGISISGSAATLTTARTIWGQSFNGSANISGNMTDVGGTIKASSGISEISFLTSSNGALNAKFGRLGVNSAYANIDLTNYVLDVGGNTRFRGDGLYYTGTKATNRMIRWIDNTSGTDGNGISIGGGGVTVIGAGEAADTIVSGKAGGDETLYLGSDGAVYIYTNTQNGMSTAKTFTFATDGTLTATKFSGPLTGNVTGNCSGSSGSCTGNAATATSAGKVTLAGSNTAFTDTATVALNGISIRWYTTASSFSGQPTQYGFLVTMATGDSANELHQIFATQANGDLYHRGTNSSSHASPPAFKTILDSSNYTSYTVTKTGSGASGSWGISVTGSSASCTGNAASAGYCTCTAPTCTKHANSSALPICRRSGKVVTVYFGGNTTTTGTGWKELGYIPTGYRPQETIYFVMNETAAGKSYRAQINTAGTLFVLAAPESTGIAGIVSYIIA